MPEASLARREQRSFLGDLKWVVVVDDADTKLKSLEDFDSGHDIVVVAHVVAGHPRIVGRAVREIGASPDHVVVAVEAPRRVED